MSNDLTVYDDIIDAEYYDIQPQQTAPLVRTEQRVTPRDQYTKRIKRHTKTVVTEDVYEDNVTHTEKDALGFMIRFFVYLASAITFFSFLLFIIASARI